MKSHSLPAEPSVTTVKSSNTPTPLRCFDRPKDSYYDDVDYYYLVGLDWNASRREIFERYRKDIKVFRSRKARNDQEKTWRGAVLWAYRALLYTGARDVESRNPIHEQHEERVKEVENEARVMRSRGGYLPDETAAPDGDPLEGYKDEKEETKAEPETERREKKTDRTQSTSGREKRDKSRRRSTSRRARYEGEGHVAEHHERDHSGCRNQ